MHSALLLLFVYVYSGLANRLGLDKVDNEAVLSWDTQPAETNSSYPLHVLTHREYIPGAIDILSIGTGYILGQTTENNSARPGYFQTKRAAAGPVQCGPGSPCLDGSCCNSDGSAVSRTPSE